MVVPPIINRINYKDFVIITLAASLSTFLTACSKGQPEPIPEAGPVKIKIDAPPVAAVADARINLPPNIFDNRLEAPDLNESEFTSLYAEGIHKALPRTKVVIEGPLKIAVKVEKEDVHDCRMDLHKLWSLCKDRPGHREEFVRPNMSTVYSMVAFINQPLAGEDPVDKIVPLVRGDKFFNALKASGHAPLDSAFYEKLNDDLYIVYAVDDELLPKPLNQEFVDRKAKIKNDQIKPTAMRNIERILAKSVTIRADGPIYSVTAGGIYEPSLILLDRFVGEFSKTVKGRLVVAMPTRGSLYFCGDATPGALPKLREVASKMVLNTKVPVSEKLYVCDGGQWKIFTAFDN